MIWMMSGGWWATSTGTYGRVVGGRNFRLSLTYCCCGNKPFVKAKRTLANWRCVTSHFLKIPKSFFLLRNWEYHSGQHENLNDMCGC